MDNFHVDITGSNEVGIRFDAFPDELYAALRDEIEALGAELLAHVEAATPTRTGRLRSEERLRIFTDPNRISAYVDIAGLTGSQDFAKASALEYGAHRPTQVRAHAMKLDHHWAFLLASPETVLVAAYTRTPDIQTYAFERGSLAAMQAQAIAGLEGVVGRSTAAANG